MVGQGLLAKKTGIIFLKFLTYAFTVNCLFLNVTLKCCFIKKFASLQYSYHKREYITQQNFESWKENEVAVAFLIIAMRGQFPYPTEQSLTFT